MQDLRSLTHAELERFASETLGEPRFRADQLFQWIHAHGALDFGAMTNLSVALRERLAQVARLDTLVVDAVAESRDGTRKLRLLAHDGAAIESVLIPDEDKLTQCISSQVGCALDCRFCATAKLGFKRNLSPGEIVDQIYRARALLSEISPSRRVTNLVYMGMGEPLHNYENVVKSLRILNHDLGAKISLRRITVSTAGLVPAIEKLGTEDVRPNLAISLNATTDEVRGLVMPINKKWNIARLLQAVRAFPLERRRRITFEYVLLEGVNDSLEDAARLAQHLRGMPCKVNLIPWNPHPLSSYRRPTPLAVERFQNEVKRLGLPTYLRTPRGDDIDAACGQLAARAKR
ncbi:MAG: 23S rRNA (adenine(2503)-C(2))-methyltransferase RlmN [Deltaproteobacteria bacterium]|nr:23S rRNA (adenine(2503)-C(2))-methyltransferase RlmN [Deltaproteobacteria bacterium]